MSEQERAIKVLVVEDHEATRKGLVAELSGDASLRVVGSAATLKEALASCSQVEPDVVLLDLHLPDSEGPRSLATTFCSKSSARVIVFSGDSRLAIRDMILKSGVSGYLLKSEPLERLVAAIKEVMSGGGPVVSSSLIDFEPSQKLTPAEEHLLSLIARGLKYKDIARQRVTSPETVRKQVDQLLEKLNLSTREELIAWAVANGYGNLDVPRE